MTPGYRIRSEFGGDAARNLGGDAGAVAGVLLGEDFTKLVNSSHQPAIGERYEHVDAHVDARHEFIERRDQICNARARARRHEHNAIAAALLGAHDRVDDLGTRNVDLVDDDSSGTACASMSASTSRTATSCANGSVSDPSTT